MAGISGTSQQLPMPIDHNQDLGSGLHGSGQTTGPSKSSVASVSNIDPLTNHLAKMSQHQLYQIMAQMKGLVQQNQHEARMILVANPQLTKALFQAQIMLGMVRPPEPAQMQAIQQNQSQAPQLPILGPPRVTGAVIPPSTTAVVTPLSSNTVLQPPASVYPQAQVNVQPQQTPGYGSVPVQLPSQQQPRPPVSVPAPVPTLQPAPSLSTGPTPPPLPPFPPPVQGQPQVTPSISFQPSPPVQQTLHRAPVQQQGGSPFSMGTVYQPPLPPQPPPQQPYQTGAPIKAPDVFRGDSDWGATAGPGPAQSSSQRLVSANTAMGQAAPGLAQTMGLGPAGLSYPGGHGAVSHQISPFPPSSGSMAGMILQPAVGPTGLGVGAAPAPMATGPVVGGQSFLPVSGTGGGSAVGGSSGPGFAHPQMYGQVRMQAPPQPQQIPLELEQQKALLQQVMNLTPEQINSLPPEQRQQVIQLQKALR